MAQQVDDHTKFNVGSLFTIPSKDKEAKKNLTIGAYNGSIQFSIRDKDFTPGNKPRSVTVSPRMAYQIAGMMKELIEAPEPGKKFTLIFNGLWNKEARKRELSFLITIGMDEQAICYIGIKHIDFNREQFTGRFDLVGDRNMEISGRYDDEKSRSFEELKMLHHLFHNLYFQEASLLTRNHLVTFGGTNNSKSTSQSASSSSADDEF